ncbi:helix-turn-helix domain-containing protein [Serpentinicella sp. ANB-PHB4]|uniref:helix-turn-helix domain-containing protein n=1 Tax=Serpentinicella sp. ANB-PHB4 TaxID=3074076 RepID=UPI002856E900|nr:helix-turn-helix domain-containing protein [Serpentinicella sp. ANB-PHB4]MDR5659649.1 helix-turn-helix domain-containing protein [Serpentinicella sp. ANB-PHB4]
MIEKFEIDNKKIGQRIRKEREQLRLSREELAEILGLSDYYVGQLERGERQMSLPVLVKITNCFHVSLDFLVFGTEKYQNDLFKESDENYKTNTDKYFQEIYDLLMKCSPNELLLFRKLISTILPHIK